MDQMMLTDVREMDSRFEGLDGTASDQTARRIGGVGH
jgi:hypothetical protein